jgi:hypothetical protein
LTSDDVTVRNESLRNVVHKAEAKRGEALKHLCRLLPGPSHLFEALTIQGRLATKAPAKCMNFIVFDNVEFSTP